MTVKKTSPTPQPGGNKKTSKKREYHEKPPGRNKEAYKKPRKVPGPAPKPAKRCDAPDCDRTIPVNNKNFCSARCRRVFDAESHANKPSQFDPKMITEEKLQEFFEHCRRRSNPEMKQVFLEGHENNPEMSKVILKQNTYFPTKQKFAKWLGISHQTLYNWEQRYASFARATERVLAEQKIWIENEGMVGNFSSKLADLFLKTDHGFTDKNEENKNVNNFFYFLDQVYDKADAIEGRNPGTQKLEGGETGGGQKELPPRVDYEIDNSS